MKTVEPAVLAEMVRRLAVEFDPQQVILFGSHAWGEPTDDSDLDLFVVVDESSERLIRRVQRAYNALGDIVVPTDVLVRTRAEVDEYRTLRASLECAVNEKGKVLYERH